MEVLLKKVKITKSVIAQSLLGRNSLYLGHPNYDVLGWCYFVSGKNSKRYILLYCKTDNTIVKLHFIREDDHEILSKNEQMRRPGSTFDDWIFPMMHSLIIELEVNGGHVTLSKNEDLKETEAARDKLRAFLREVFQKGQIYI